MHPMDEDLANMALCYMDENGRLHPMQLGTTEIAPAAEGSKDIKDNPLLVGCSVEPISATLRVKRGAIDHLFHRPTLAAYRYMRLQIRRKEKARRKKLKEANKNA